MSLLRVRRTAWLIAMLTLVVSLSGPAAWEVNAQDEDLGSLEGAIDIDGSSTVAPVTEAVAEEFAAAGAENVEVSVGVSGTGGGFERFCASETDIQDASRAIGEDELAACAEASVDFYQFELGQDGITVAVNPANDFLTCISTDLLASMWSDGSTVATFADINSEFPDDEINLYGPGPDSGTFDFFNEAILGEDVEPTTDYTPSEDDNVLVEGVSGDENALGYFGYAYFIENEEILKAVAISEGDNTDNCVEPTADTIRDGSYVLSRPLFIYVNAESLQDPVVESFVRFYLENAETLVEEVAYIPLPSEEYTAAQEKLDGAISGEAEPDSAATPEA